MRDVIRRWSDVLRSLQVMGMLAACDRFMSVVDMLAGRRYVLSSSSGVWTNLDSKTRQRVRETLRRFLK